MLITWPGNYNRISNGLGTARYVLTGASIEEEGFSSSGSGMGLSSGKLSPPGNLHGRLAGVH
jgi:hypothetical protein